jgi:FMN-dependent NADH-azoreductase
VGLLRDKRAYLVMSSGGTQLGGPVDFASTHLRHVMGFLGIKDVELVAVDRLAVDAEASVAGARARIAQLGRSGGAELARERPRPAAV